MNDTILSVRDLVKVYSGEGPDFRALDGVSLDIRRGEILALLGPNGAGKTTLISTICGVTRPTSGTVDVDGFDIRDQYRAARSLIGLVPQEIALEPFAPVGRTVAFSRGLFGLSRDDRRIEEVLRTLSLWDKRDSPIRELSGGMKRRVLIAKALAHDPKILFLDEPTAGVDVELRRDMWDVVAKLREEGVTTILTTHYIEEAEAIADRIAVIQGGRILLIEEKAKLMARMGHRELRVDLVEGVSRPCRPRSPPSTWNSRTTAARSFIPTTRRRSARASRRCSRPSTRRGCACATCAPVSRRSKTSSWS